MKIISKYKDYYDYLQGIYGIDEKIVYRRSTYNPFSIGDGVNSYKPHFLVDKLSNANKIIPYTFAICGKLYSVMWCAGKLVTSHKELEIRKSELNLTSVNGYADYLKGSVHFGRSTNVNADLNCPIVLLNNDRWGRVTNKGVLNPKLSDFEFNRVIGPEDMYLSISEFLSREPEIKDTRTNDMKIESYGFDKITSFRNKK